MFTTIDKAIAAVLGGLVSFLALKFGIQADWLTPDLINTLSVAIAGALVYLVPNKKPAE
jgi:zinc transporter ZupT